MSQQPLFTPDQMNAAYRQAAQRQQAVHPEVIPPDVDTKKPGPVKKANTGPDAQPEAPTLPVLTISPLWFATAWSFSVSLIAELIATKIQLPLLTVLPMFLGSTVALGLGIYARKLPYPKSMMFAEVAIAIAAAPALPKLVFLLLQSL